MSNQKHQNKNVTLLSQLTCTKKVQYVRYQIHYNTNNVHK
jgi:hypothetical protein